MRLRFWLMRQTSGVITAKRAAFLSKASGVWAAEPKVHFRFSKKQKHTSLTSKLSIVYSKYNYVRYLQSAASWQPVVLQSSCPVMPVLTEHGLEIAGLVLRGWKKPQLERLPCAQRCDHNIIKWKKKQEIMGRAKEKRDPPLVMNESVSEESRAWRDTTIACFWTVCGSCSHVIALLRVQPPFGG